MELQELHSNPLHADLRTLGSPFKSTALFDMKDVNQKHKTRCHDSGHYILFAMNYIDLTDLRTLGRPIHVNGTFCSTLKSHNIIMLNKRQEL